MAVNFGANIPANQTVAGVFNPAKGVNDLPRPQDTPQRPSSPQQHNPATPTVKHDPKAIAVLDAQREQDERARTTFDKPDRNTAKALNAYNSVADTERKSQLHDMLGVDLYI